jgi:hypothetical protein
MAEEIQREQREERGSIELTRGANGVYRWSVKVFFAEGAHFEAFANLAEIDKQLQVRYGQ